MLLQAQFDLELLCLPWHLVRKPVLQILEQLRYGLTQQLLYITGAYAEKDKFKNYAPIIGKKTPCD